MKDAERSFLKVKKKYLKFIEKQEILGDPFFDKSNQLRKFYLPISESIYSTFKNRKKSLIIGLSGSQGSGKTTISKILKIILTTKFKLNVVCLSIDDFYKTRKQREKMSKEIHKLFLTRGVPGTHEVALLRKTFKKLTKRKFKTVKIPRFNKASDERLPIQKWIKIKKKPDIVIFEGWCVGAKYQKKNLKKAVNILEKHEDAKLKWRKKVNNELKTNYKRIFQLIDKQIFLKVPNLKYVYKWRELQEKKLRSFSKGKKTMDKKGIYRFIMHYERLTRDMINDLSKTADMLINIDKKHKLKNIKFNYQ